MGIFNFGKEKETQQAFKESLFECTRGELTIRGTEYRPKGDNLPVAIVCHGFMAFQDTVRHYAKALAGLGYVAYCFDFCGGSVLNKGKSDGATTDMSVLTEVKDLEAVISYVQSLDYTNDELFLMGCSQGGFVSALFAAKHPEMVSKLCLFYPAFCIPDDARAGKMMFAKFDPSNIPEQFSCGPMKLGRCYPADVLELGPYEEIAPFHGEVLIVHGTKDAIVHPDYSKKAQQTYKNAKLEIIQGGAHGFSSKHDEIAIGYLCEFARRGQNEE